MVTFPALISFGDSSGDAALWIGWIALATVGFVVGRRIFRRLFPRSKTLIRRQPATPTHPVVLPPHQVRQRADEFAGPLLPIVTVRDLVGPPPRRFTSEIQKYLTIQPPPWLKRRSKDEMLLPFLNQERIRREGTVVWAATVQANSNLFRRGPNDHGASVIFSMDPWYDKHPEELLETARDLFALKGTDQNDAEAAAFARMLTNEMTRAMMLRAPKRFTGGRNVFHSSIMLPRKHLPHGFLSGRLMPVWVDPAGTGLLLLVPAAYWPPSLTAMWDRPPQAPRVNPRKAGG